MNRAEPNPSTIRVPSTPLEDLGQMGVMLNLHPFPALLVENGSGNVLVANESARRLGLPPSMAPNSATDCQATDAQGNRIEVEQFTRYLVTAANGPEGVEITCQIGSRNLSFRVFTRALPPSERYHPLSLLTFLDITGQKVVEAELREALEARNEFFSVATHELKDPLFALQLSIQLLRRAAEKLGEVPPHVLQHLEISDRQADRLGRLIENLLDISRIINHRHQLDLETLDLGALAVDVASRLQEKARLVGTTITVEAEGPVMGDFDRLKLEQVLGNLLTNAIKYGAGQPITVRVGGTEEQAQVDVEDRGVGIAPHDQERIFQRFERASSNFKRDSLGLGLYIVRSFVEAHNGSIKLYSELNKGSIFTITLPRNCLLRTTVAAREDGSGSPGE